MNEHARDLLQAWYACYPGQALHLKQLFKYVRENASDPSAALLMLELYKILPAGRAKLSTVTVARYLQKIADSPVLGTNLVVSRRMDPQTKSYRWQVSPPGTAISAWFPRKYKRAPKVVAAEKVVIAEARAVAVQVMERRAAETPAPGAVGLTVADHARIASFKTPQPVPQSASARKASRPARHGVIATNSSDTGNVGSALRYSYNLALANEVRRDARGSLFLFVPCVADDAAGICMELERRAFRARVGTDADSEPVPQPAYQPLRVHADTRGPARSHSRDIFGF